MEAMDEVVVIGRVRMVAVAIAAPVVVGVGVWMASWVRLLQIVIDERDLLFSILPGYFP